MTLFVDWNDTFPATMNVELQQAGNLHCNATFSVSYETIVYFGAQNTFKITLDTIRILENIISID